MKYEELENFSNDELSYFTNEDLEMIPADLRRRILNNNAPLPPSAIIKLNAMIDQANEQIANPKKKIKKKISKDTKAIDLFGILIQIIANASQIAESFIYILENLFP